MDESAIRKEVLSWRWPGFWALNLPALLLLWHVLLARGLFVPAETYQYVIAAALGWLFLSAERWVSLTLRPSPREVLAEQRGAIFRLWGMIGFSFLLVAYFRLSYWETMATTVYIGLAGIYIITLLRWREVVTRWFSSEVFLSALTAAPVIFIVAANSVFSPFRIVLPVLLFFFLIFYYVALQYRWNPEEAAPGTPPLLSSPIGPVCRGLPIAIMLIGGLMGLTGRLGAGSLVLLAVAISAGLLVLLEFWEEALGPEQCRRLADLALLTPLPVVLLGF